MSKISDLIAEMDDTLRNWDNRFNPDISMDGIKLKLFKAFAESIDYIEDHLGIGHAAQSTPPVAPIVGVPQNTEVNTEANTALTDK